MDYFVYRAAKEIGALTACSVESMAGVHCRNRRELAGDPPDESAKRRRGWVSNSMKQPTANHRSKISTARSKVSVWVIPTNEELMIARHTGRCLDLQKLLREG